MPGFFYLLMKCTPTTLIEFTSLRLLLPGRGAKSKAKQSKAYLKWVLSQVAVLAACSYLRIQRYLQRLNHNSGGSLSVLQNRFLQSFKAPLSGTEWYL